MTFKPVLVDEFVGLDDPAVLLGEEALGAAFLVAILFSLIGKPEANKDQRFEDEKIRTYLGIGAE